MPAVSDLPMTRRRTRSSPRIVLPKACRNKKHPSNSDLPKTPPTFLEISSNIEGIPPDFVTTKPFHPLEPMSLITYQDHTIRKPPIPLPSLPTNVTLVCIPDGIVVDSSIAGPYRQDEKSPIHLYQSKMWFPGADQVNDSVKRQPRVQHVHKLGVQLSSWTGFTWSLFSLDTLIRLGLVYDLLMSDEPLWKDAQIIVSMELDYGTARLFTGEQRVEPMVQWLYDKLNLTRRLVPNNGWIVKANYTTRFDFLVFPDVTPHSKCGPNKQVLRPIFPRGTLQSIQRALGLTASTRKKYIVYASRRDVGNRAVEATRRELILKSIQNLLLEMNNSALEVIEHTHKSPADTFQVYRQAAVVVGPHGGNLWNAIFAPPGGLLIEFSSIKAEFLDEDCRTCAFSLANAASLQYALVETKNFGYREKDLLPEVEDVVELIRAFLTDNDLDEVPSAPGHLNPAAKSRTTVDSAEYQGDMVDAIVNVTKQTPTSDTRDETQDAHNSLVVDPAYLRYLKALDPIPHKVHIFFPNKTVLEHSEIAMVRHGVLNLVELNPDWEVAVYDSADISNIIGNATLLLSQEEREIMQKAHVVEKTNLARLLLMYTVGGVYVDVDRVINIPLHKVIHSRTRLCMPTNYDVNFMQSIMCSSPKNKVVNKAIERQSQLRMAGGKYGGKLERRGGWVSRDDTIRLGPDVWSQALISALFDIDRALGEKEMGNARAAIQATKGIIITKKDVWCDGMLVEPFEGCRGVGREDLYNLYNIPAWGEQVDALWKDTPPLPLDAMKSRSSRIANVIDKEKCALLERPPPGPTFPHVVAQSTTTHPFQLALYPEKDDVMRYGIYTDGQYYEMGLTRFVEWVCEGETPEDAIYLDVGANVGWVTAVLASFGKTVYSFEPTPNTFALLKHSVERNCWKSKVHLHHAAVGEKSGKSVVFKIFPSAPGTNAVTHILEVNEDPSPLLRNDNNLVVMKQLRLEDCIPPGKQIPLFKLDVESFEYNVLLGALSLFQERRVHYLHIEWSDRTDAMRKLAGRILSWGYRFAPTTRLPATSLNTSSSGKFSEASYHQNPVSVVEHALAILDSNEGLDMNCNVVLRRVDMKANYDFNV